MGSELYNTHVDVDRFCRIDPAIRATEALIARQHRLNGTNQIEIARLSFESLAIAFGLVNYIRI